MSRTVVRHTTALCVWVGLIIGGLMVTPNPTMANVVAEAFADGIPLLALLTACRLIYRSDQPHDEGVAR